MQEDSDGSNEPKAKRAKYDDDVWCKNCVEEGHSSSEDKRCPLYARRYAEKLFGQNPIRKTTKMGLLGCLKDEQFVDPFRKHVELISDIMLEGSFLIESMVRSEYGKFYDWLKKQKGAPDFSPIFKALGKGKAEKENVKGNPNKWIHEFIAENASFKGGYDLSYLGHAINQQSRVFETAFKNLIVTQSFKLIREYFVKLKMAETAAKIEKKEITDKTKIAEMEAEARKDALEQTFALFQGDMEKKDFPGILKDRCYEKLEWAPKPSNWWHFIPFFVNLQKIIPFKVCPTFDYGLQHAHFTTEVLFDFIKKVEPDWMPKNFTDSKINAENVREKVWDKVFRFEDEEIDEHFGLFISTNGIDISIVRAYRRLEDTTLNKDPVQLSLDEFDTYIGIDPGRKAMLGCVITNDVNFHLDFDEYGVPRQDKEERHLVHSKKFNNDRGDSAREMARYKMCGKECQKTVDEMQKDYRVRIQNEYPEYYKRRYQELKEERDKSIKAAETRQINQAGRKARRSEQKKSAGKTYDKVQKKKQKSVRRTPKSNDNTAEQPKKAEKPKKRKKSKKGEIPEEIVVDLKLNEPETHKLATQWRLEYFQKCQRLCSAPCVVRLKFDKYIQTQKLVQKELQYLRRAGRKRKYHNRGKKRRKGRKSSRKKRIFVAVGEFCLPNGTKGYQQVPLRAFRTALEQDDAFFVYKMDEFRTTGNCSRCNGSCPPSTSPHRFQYCPYCGITWHRDVNAARNILRLALIKAKLLDKNTMWNHGNFTRKVKVVAPPVEYSREYLAKLAENSP